MPIPRISYFLVGCLIGIGIILTLEPAPATMIFSSGIDGYSGNPATNGGATCNACHNGGSAPTVTLDGPTTVFTGNTYSYSLEISGGQQTAGGLDVSTTAGTLVATHPNTYIFNSEVTHFTPELADGSGKVTFTFDWTAPASPQAVTLYGAGNSVDGNGITSGDRAGTDQLGITVTNSCMVAFSQYGAGTPGTGGLVPDLNGNNSLCTGGYSIDVTQGRPGAPGFLWITAGQGNLPFACGNLLLHLGGLFLKVGVSLDGGGSLSLTDGDLTPASGATLYLQGLFLDPNACQGISLTNGLTMAIG